MPIRPDEGGEEAADGGFAELCKGRRLIILFAQHEGRRPEAYDHMGQVGGYMKHRLTRKNRQLTTATATATTATKTTFSALEWMNFHADGHGYRGVIVADDGDGDDGDVNA